MKIKFLAFCLAFCSLGATSVFAQSAVRLQGGINLANVSVTSNGRVNNANQLTTYQLGIVGDFHLGSIVYLQPGVLYTGKGTKSQSGNETDFNFYRATSNPFYLEVPLNLVFKLPLSRDNKIFVGAGPYAAVGINGKNKVQGRYAGVDFNSENAIKFSNDDPTTLNYEEGAGFGILKRFDYGLNGTAGIEGKSLVLGVDYGLGLAKLQSGSNSSADNNNKHRVLSIFLGFKL
jgi:hypothetical protein